MKSDYSKLNFQNIATYLWLGRDAVDWYARQRDVLIELFGAQNLVTACQLLAATSINTELRANVTLFSRAIAEIKAGEDVGSYLPIIRKQIQAVREGKGLSGRKISAFARALAGDQHAVVVDVWMYRAFGVKPTDHRYTLIENWIVETAPTMGLTPCQLQAVIWVGIRKHSTQGQIMSYEQALKTKFQNMFDAIN